MEMSIIIIIIISFDGRRWWCRYGGRGGGVVGRGEGGRGNEVGLQCMRFVLSYPETAVKHRRTLLPARPVNGG